MIDEKSQIIGEIQQKIKILMFYVIRVKSKQKIKIK